MLWDEPGVKVESDLYNDLKVDTGVDWKAMIEFFRPELIVASQPSAIQLSRQMNDVVLRTYS